MASEWVDVGEESGFERPRIGGVEAMSKVEFTLNGAKRTVLNPDPEMLLVDYLRRVENLVGTKKSCGEGGCGACTVLLSTNGEPPVPVNSCLRLLCSVNGQEVTTIEGVGSAKSGYNPVQKKLAECNGSQCGFCSPGMVMSMMGLLHEKSSPSPKEVEHQFDGNLCRCTGYRPILDAMQSFSSAGGGIGDMEDLCKPKSVPPSAGMVRRLFGNELVSWYSPSSLADLQSLVGRLDPSSYRLVASNTGTVGVAKYYNGSSWGEAVPTPPVFIDLQHVPELKAYSVKDSGLEFGSGTTLAQLIVHLEQHTQLSTSYGPIAAHVSKIASHPVRNAATVGGNLMLAHQYDMFASDLNLLMTAARATVSILGPDSVSTMTMAEFHKMDMTGHVLVSIQLPTTQQHFRTFKIMPRHINSHAYVNAAFSMSLDSNNEITGATLCYGGVVKGVLEATRTASVLVGNSVTSESTLEAAFKSLVSEVKPDSVFGRDDYRMRLVTNLFYKFFLSLQPSLPSDLQAAAQEFDRPVSSGKWDIAEAEDESEFPVSKPINKISALKQTAGEAHYSDDKPPPAGTLFGAFVIADRANATIGSIDPSKALAMTGVVTFIDGQAVVAAGFRNGWNDEPLFATDKVVHAGERVGMIIADTQAHADHAAKAVQVTYSKEEEPILTMQQAIAAKAFYSQQPDFLEMGDADAALKAADHVVEGAVECGHQYHFYMETQTSHAEPAGDGVVVTAANQSPQALQQGVATAINKKMSDVEVRMGRAGGAYGGKYSRSFPSAVATSMAALMLNAPVRMVVDLNTNMAMLGSRRPHRMEYKVGVSNEGRITAVTGTIYNLQGAHSDLGYWDNITVAMSIDNAYNIANWKVAGLCLRTNTPSNTWCRAPGFAPGVFMIESMVDHVAGVLGMSADAVRWANMYSINDVTPLGQKLVYCNQRPVYEAVKQQANYDTLRQSVADFNASNRFVKQGLAVVPGKYLMPLAVGFTATVTVNTDGSVLVQQSGCESGQGLDTKVVQVAALTLGVDLSMISIDGVTSKISTGLTGGSITSEGNCASVKLACEELLKQWEVVKAELRGRLGRNPQWMELVEAAVSSGARMQASAVYNKQQEPGLPVVNPNGSVQYVSYGAAVVQVQVDALTGEVQLLRSDVVLDCGISLNPAIDAGQVQGAFVMGLGYVLSEEFLWDDGRVSGINGHNLTNGTWEYKPPSVLDIPIDFNITMLPHAPNKLGILSSKATGEPSFVLGVCALFAVKDAVRAVLQQIGKSGANLIMDGPSLPDAVQLASQVDWSQLHLQ